MYQLVVGVDVALLGDLDSPLIEILGFWLLRLMLFLDLLQNRLPLWQKLQIYGFSFGLLPFYAIGIDALRIRLDPVVIKEILSGLVG